MPTWSNPRMTTTSISATLSTRVRVCYEGRRLCNEVSTAACARYDPIDPRATHMCGGKVELPSCRTRLLSCSRRQRPTSGPSAALSRVAHCHNAVTSVDIMRWVRVSADVFSGTQGSGYQTEAVPQLNRLGRYVANKRPNPKSRVVAHQMLP